MKRTILFLILAVMFIACQPVEETVIPETPTIRPIPEATPEPIIPDEPLEKVKFALYDGQNLKLWDGEKLKTIKQGIVRVAGPRKLSIDDVLYYFDEYGNSVHSKWLPGIPRAILAVPTESKASTVYEDDIYTLIDIPPAEAYALGARYKNYTRIFKNSVEIGVWYEHEWGVSSVLKPNSGHIITIDLMGAYRNLTDRKTIYCAIQDGLLVYNVDEVNMNGYFNDGVTNYYCTWGNGYFHHSRWQKANGTWYTENGFKWDSSISVIVRATQLYKWNEYDLYPQEYKDNSVYGERPYILPAGVRTENSEEVTYWIETVTGVLYRHIPSIDRLDYIAKLYIGPETRMGAIPYFNTLDPEIIGDEMFFHADGMIQKIDLITKIITQFAPEENLIVWE